MLNTDYQDLVADPYVHKVILCKPFAAIYNCWLNKTGNSQLLRMKFALTGWGVPGRHHKEEKRRVQRSMEEKKTREEVSRNPDGPTTNTMVICLSRRPDS